MPFLFIVIAFFIFFLQIDILLQAFRSLFAWNWISRTSWNALQQKILGKLNDKGYNRVLEKTPIYSLSDHFSEIILFNYFCRENTFIHTSLCIQPNSNELGFIPLSLLRLIPSYIKTKKAFYSTIMNSRPVNMLENLL